MPVQSQELLRLLHAYALRSRSADVDLRAFVASLSPDEGAPGDILSAVQELSARGALTLYTDSEGPRTVFFPDFPLISLLEDYRQLSIHSFLPFPREGSTEVPVPASEITTVEVMNELGPLMETSASEVQGVARLLFPGDVPSLLVPRSCAATLLMDAAVLRISGYIQEPRNSAFVESKLSAALKGSELLVRQNLEEAAQSLKKAAASVFAPSEFNFRFWTQLCSIVLQDVSGRTKQTEADIALCQSAHLITSAVFHRKAEMQREAERAADRKILERQVRNAPFLFREQDLHDLADDKGIPYAVKHGRDFIHSFLVERLRKAEDEPLPPLVRIHEESSNADYIVHRDLVVPVFLDKLAETAEGLRTGYLESWTASLKADSTPREARNDALFRADVEARVRERFPLLAALANGDILFLAADSPLVTAEAREELRRCFLVETILRPFHELLDLSRVNLLKAARANLPFWQTVPILSAIVRLFRRLLQPPARGKEAVPDPGAASRSRDGTASPGPGLPEDGGIAGSTDTRSMLRSRGQIRSLLAFYVPKGTSVDETLADLADRWNPLLESGQKQDLVDDVNALVRDLLRPIRRAVLSRPIDQQRIRALARQISENRNLSKIRNRDPLMRYIELYVIKTLLAG